MNALGTRLRELRKANGLLLRQSAAHLDMDPALMSRIESGAKRPLETQVVKLADLYNVSPSELLKLWLCDMVVEVVDGKSEAIAALELARTELARR